MRSNLFLTCVPLLLLIASIGSHASPVVLGEANPALPRQASATLVARAKMDLSEGDGVVGGGDFGGVGGAGGTVDGIIDAHTPPCIVHTGFGSFDGVTRTHSLSVSTDGITDPTLHWWQATMQQGRDSALLTVKVNKDRNIEIKALAASRVTLPGFLEVAMYPDQKAGGSHQPVKYYLDTKKGSTCHIYTAHSPGYYSAMTIAY